LVVRGRARISKLGSSYIKPARRKREKATPVSIHELVAASAEAVGAGDTGFTVRKPVASP